MNERDVQLESRKIFVFILLLFCLLGLFFKTIAYPLGVIIGYIVCYINFMLTIKFSHTILQEGHQVILIILMFMLKLILMIIGFMLAVIWKEYVHLLGVFLGYLITPITIYWLNIKKRKEMR